MSRPLRFAAIGLDHRHIYHLVGELIASEPQACPPALPTSLTAVASNCFAFDGGQACELAISGSGLQPFAQVDYCVDDVVPCGDAPIGPGADADGSVDHLAVASCPAGRSMWVQSTTASGELIVSEIGRASGRERV